MSNRPTWDEYFLHLAAEVGRRATCDRGRSGCVVVRDRRILCTGYVGAPPGLPHCDDVGHQLEEMTNEDGVRSIHCVRTVHAEQNAIAQAARHGISLEGATFYCTMEPCRTCAMLIASVGATRVLAGQRYHAGAASREILKQAGVALQTAHDEVAVYARSEAPVNATPVIGIGDYVQSELAAEHIQAAYRAGVCPTCGSAITDGGYGTGRLADGKFCSLDCFARFAYPSGSSA